MIAKANALSASARTLVLIGLMGIVAGPALTASAQDAGNAPAQEQTAGQNGAGQDANADANAVDPDMLAAQIADAVTQALANGEDVAQAIQMVLTDSGATPEVATQALTTAQTQIAQAATRAGQTVPAAVTTAFTQAIQVASSLITTPGPAATGNGNAGNAANNPNPNANNGVNGLGNGNLNNGNNGIAGLTGNLGAANGLGVGAGVGGAAGGSGGGGGGGGGYRAS